MSEVNTDYYLSIYLPSVSAQVTYDWSLQYLYTVYSTTYSMRIIKHSFRRNLFMKYMRLRVIKDKLLLLIRNFRYTGSAKFTAT